MTEHTEELHPQPATIPAESVEAIVKALKIAADKAVEAFKRLYEYIKIAIDVISKKLINLFDSALYCANQNPRWWHLYKNAKKTRIRKKYRHRLVNQLLSKLKAQEVST